MKARSWLWTFVSPTLHNVPLALPGAPARSPLVLVPTAGRATPHPQASMPLHCVLSISASALLQSHLLCLLLRNHESLVAVSAPITVSLVPGMVPPTLGTQELLNEWINS